MASSEVICKSSFGFSTICKIADLSPPELSSDFKFSCSSLSLVQFFFSFFYYSYTYRAKTTIPLFCSTLQVFFINFLKFTIILFNKCNLRNSISSTHCESFFRMIDKQNFNNSSLIIIN